MSSSITYNATSGLLLRVDGNIKWSVLWPFSLSDVISWSRDTTQSDQSSCQSSPATRITFPAFCPGHWYTFPLLPRIHLQVQSSNTHAHAEKQYTFSIYTISFFWAIKNFQSFWHYTCLRFSNDENMSLAMKSSTPHHCAFRRTFSTHSHGNSSFHSSVAKLLSSTSTLNPLRSSVSVAGNIMSSMRQSFLLSVDIP